LSIEEKKYDIESVVRTSDQYRQRGKVVNKRSTQPPNTSQKSVLSKQKSHFVAREQKNLQ
jgi:hypothetical protein